MQIKAITTLMISAILFTACKQQSGAEQEIHNELHFRTFIETDGKLHPVAASRTLAGSLADGYYLSALLTTADYPSATHDKLMWNVTMNRDGTYKSPNEKKYFWVNSATTLRHSFAAYSANPSSGLTTGDGVNASTLAVGSDGRVRVEYTNPQDPAKQIDLLCSDNVHNVKVATSAPIIDLVFKHRLSRLVFKLMGTGNVSLLSCQAKVRYKANSVARTATVPLSENTAVALKSIYHSGTYNLGSSFSMSSSATTPQAAVEIGDMILLPQNLADGWLTLTLTYTPENGTPKTASVSIDAINLSAAAGKQHEVLINVMEYSAQLSVAGITLTNWNSISGDIDLEGPKSLIDYTATPANCYVAYPKDGVMQGVKFNALKKPIAKYSAGVSSIANAVGENLSTASADNTLANNIVHQEGDKIEVTWQTSVNHSNTGGADNMVIKSIILGTDGITTVEVNGVGNALLSYKRGSTILWNYHIWVTETDPTKTHYPNTGGNVNGRISGGAQTGFMDRNLGALSATSAKPSTSNAYKYFGVIYQHGRPTPFSGQGIGTAVNTYTSIYTGAGTKITSGTVGNYTQSTTAVSSVKSAIENPMTYNYNSSNTWFSVDISLWSDYSTKSKSIYDPCPYGYRVPRSGEGAASSWYGFPAVSSTSIKIDNGSTWLNTWWPMAGRRTTSGALENIGTYGFYWSSSRHSDAYRSYNLYFSYNGGVYTSDYASRSSGGSVRCVEEGY